MLDQLRDFIREEDLFKPNEGVLLAVSGGVDSVCLAHLLHKAGIKFGIAHCNFNLRGSDSDGDAKFVEALAKSLQSSYLTTSFKAQEYAEQNGVSIQMAARDLRYQWLETIRSENGFACIATAHHLNDSMETLLLNLTKGTGIKGLHGILPKAGKIVRPLLFASRAQVLNYVDVNNITYREDASNSLSKYQRNLIRNEVIPILRQINPDLENTFDTNIKHFRDAEKIYTHAIEKFRKDLLKQDGYEFKLPFRKLLKFPAPQTLCYELLKEFGFNGAQVQQLLHTGIQAGKFINSATHRVLRDRNHWIITPLNVRQSRHHFISKADGNMQFEDLQLRIRISEISDFNISKDPATGALDFDKLDWPLQLRHWSAGDYFYPLGLKKASQKPARKKLSDYFTDRKMSIPEKENTWILCSGKRVAWVVGHRIDERFKVSPKTKKVCILEQIPS